jgi:hypothetical protein
MSRHAHRVKPTAALNERQRRLYDAVLANATSVDQRLTVIYPLALRHACAERDVQVVRVLLLGGQVRECTG